MNIIIVLNILHHISVFKCDVSETGSFSFHHQVTGLEVSYPLGFLG
jgi:hypothetical protein